VPSGVVAPIYFRGRERVFFLVHLAIFIYEQPDVYHLAETLTVSTRTQVVVDHRLEDYRDPKAAVALLGQAVPAALAVESYGHSVEPENPATEPESWRPAQHHSADQLDYVSPDGSLVSFGQHVVLISASARWSGFLTIEPLRNVHLAAFRSIARCIRGSRLVLLPDAIDEGYDAINEGISLEDCAARLRKRYGPPQRSVGAIPPNAFIETIPGSHLVWFSEAL